MTPSTGIMNYIAGKEEEYGILVEQAEDEIAAINMALGASFAGARAATGSSGGGFALMVEGLSLAAITELPIVIFEVQRPGPATGLPTRTEQADLLFVIHSAHGEFPRVVFTPGSPEQLIMLTNKAFDMAEKYQIPVFVMFDQYLGDSQWTYDSFDTAQLKYTDYRIRGKEARDILEYKRHADTYNGVSPLVVPGDGHEHLVITDSDEHDETGHLIEDAATRIKMVNKRLHNKINAIRNEMAPPVLYGSKGAPLVLVGWGSTYGVLRETVDILNAKNDKNACMIFFSEIYPLPHGEYIDILRSAKQTVCVEGNATGQFATLLRSETGIEFNHMIHKYDGRPFTVPYIMQGLEEMQ
jgi:2-oxoglutarate ferredoxin oxidoreductase subunit alpha